jgi:hypothetical protein
LPADQARLTEGGIEAEGDPEAVRRLIGSVAGAG